MNSSFLDTAMAIDLLVVSKDVLRRDLDALTESVTPIAIKILRRQLEEDLALHEEISNLLVAQGWLLPYDVNEQFQLDGEFAQTSMADQEWLPVLENRPWPSTWTSPEK